MIVEATRRLERGAWSDLAALSGIAAVGGVSTAVVGVYPVFFLTFVLVTAPVAFISAEAATVLLMLTAPIVALGSIDLGFSLLPSYVVAVAGLGGVLWRRSWRTLSFGYADLMLLGFMLIACVISMASLGAVPSTTVAGADGVNSHELRSAAQLAAIVLMGGIYLLVRIGTSKPRAVHSALRALVVATFLVAAYAAYQLVGRKLGLPYTFVNVRRAVSTLPTGADYIRVNSTLTEASPLAQFMIIGLFLGVARLRTLSRPSWLSDRVAFVVSAVTAAVIVATLSKSAWLACVVWLGALLFVLRDRARAGAAWGYVALTTTLAAVATAAMVLTRGAGDSPLSFIDSERYLRAGFWEAGWKMLIENPAGIGVGNYAFFYPLYAPLTGAQEYEPGVADAHNLVLEAAVETGVLGGLFFTLFLGLVVAGGFGAPKRVPGNALTPSFVALAAGFGAGVTMHLTYSFFYFPFEWALAGIVGSAATVLGTVKAREAPSAALGLLPAGD